jgi:hypothetical protein
MTAQFGWGEVALGLGEKRRCQADDSGECTDSNRCEFHGVIGVIGICFCVEGKNEYYSSYFLR